jgi:hypothetical protein
MAFHLSQRSSFSSSKAVLIALLVASPSTYTVNELSNQQSSSSPSSVRQAKKKHADRPFNMVHCVFESLPKQTRAKCTDTVCGLYMCERFPPRQPYCTKNFANVKSLSQKKRDETVKQSSVSEFSGWFFCQKSGRHIIKTTSI